MTKRMSRFIDPQPQREPREPRVEVDLYALTKNTIIEMFELIADETRQTSIKSFLHLRQSALQSDQNEAVGALV